MLSAQAYECLRHRCEACSAQRCGNGQCAGGRTLATQISYEGCIKPVTWRKTVATEWSACSGHGSNQSMTVLLTRPGKLRQRVRSVSPTGDIASTKCKLLRHCSTNCAQQASLLSFVPCFTACNRSVAGQSILSQPSCQACLY